jgi:hypothetical protein
MTKYNKFTKVGFGMYKGYELGIIYICDPEYVEWSINNVADFSVEDISDLQDHYVINDKIDYSLRLIGDPELVPYLNIFSIIQRI